MIFPRSCSRFQALSAAYKVLSDPEKRAVYDETGEVDDEDVVDKDKDWDQYWRLLFKVGDGNKKRICMAFLKK